ncbi:MAG: stress response translation initiation inhibitor YciH [Halobacteriota archaeon]
MAKDDTLGHISGLPEELGIDDDLGRSQQLLRVRMDTRRYGKPVTIVSGFDRSVTDVREVASELKRRLACGGTVEGDEIELQGNHERRVVDILGELGFTVE